ncbi:hypothetical protein R1sor_021787 [Riccia sorocarpa]|uniref:Zinc finger CCCH-type with G patch domain-containing protein n=1 Tax=Riccia sorocarpa TaxID=122646 RepID=A0ABD3GJH5_9MARC
MDGPVDIQLEQELESHIQDQRASVIEINEALESDPTNSELLQVKEELLACLKTAEDSAFQLKRARLLHELDSIPSVEGTQTVTLSSAGGRADDPDSELNSVEESPELVQLSSFAEGSKCRFRHTDGRWYNGRVHSVDEAGLARVFFLSPTNEKMQICRFFLQQRCRFGGNCRQSHGVEVPMHALRLFSSPDRKAVPLGTTVWACDGDKSTELWKQAELESWNDEGYQKASVVFVADGKKAVVDAEKMALSEYADMSDQSSDSSSEEDDEEEDEELEEEGEVEGTEGIGILVPAGPQTDTVTFANWERHTRGVASKMMASMGYRVGMGLGKSGQGPVVPIEARVLPPRQSLDFMNETKRKEKDKGGKKVHEGKKKTRGGKRSRAKKWAAASLAAKIEQDKAPDVFGIINQHLAPVVEAEASFGSGSQRFESRGSDAASAQRKTQKKEDRRSILAHQDNILEIRSRISKLEEMAHRNRKEKALYDGINRKLEVARKALLDAEAAHASATHEVHSKEKEKKWLRF